MLDMTLRDAAYLVCQEKSSRSITAMLMFMTWGLRLKSTV